MPQYADAAALAAYPGGSDVPAEDVPVVLRLANRVVSQMLRLRVYDVDEAGVPTDAEQAQACADAACAVAVELSATGAVRAGATQEWDSVSIGGVALSGRTQRAGGTTVMGLPVPAVAVVLLSDVGTMYVSAGRGYSRPLDRVAR